MTGANLTTLNATFFRLSRISIEADQFEDIDGGVALFATTRPNSIATRERGEIVAHHEEKMVELLERRKINHVTSAKNKDTMKISVARIMRN